MNKSVAIIIFVAVLLVAGIFLIFSRPGVGGVTSFKECVERGYQVMESQPRQCVTPDGETFVEELEEEPGPITTHSDIRVTTNLNEPISSPLTISGEARGPWYFEADFPVRIIDVNGRELGIAPAQAQGDWMTTDFVPFSVTIEFTQPTAETGWVILEKDNPSGKAELADELRIPVRFAQFTSTPEPRPSPQLPVASAECRPTGCSAQICSDQDVITTCEFRSEYACYQNAKCERQTTGQCGWTQTPALSQCLAQSR
jgi:hypothetical protein